MQRERNKKKIVNKKAPLKSSHRNKWQNGDTITDSQKKKPYTPNHNKQTHINQTHIQMGNVLPQWHSDWTSMKWCFVQLYTIYAHTLTHFLLTTSAT